MYVSRKYKTPHERSETRRKCPCPVAEHEHIYTKTTYMLKPFRRCRSSIAVMKILTQTVMPSSKLWYLRDETRRRGPFDRVVSEHCATHTHILLHTPALFHSEQNALPAIYLAKQQNDVAAVGDVLHDPVEIGLQHHPRSTHISCPASS